MAYQSSHLILTNTGLNVPIAGTPAGPMVMALATAPQGPDVPALIDPALLAATYGAAASSPSYSMPLGMSFLTTQTQGAGASSPLSILGCRVGVTRASVTVGGLTITAVGSYAGSKGNTTAVQITVAGGFVTSLSLVDTSTPGGPTVLYTITNATANLTTYANIIRAIQTDQDPLDPNTLIGVSAAGGVYPPAAIAAPGTALTGGADGLGALPTDATIATLLAQSMDYDVDFVWPAFDAVAIGATMLAHVAAAYAEYSFRKVVLGPQMGTSYSTLTSTGTPYGSQFSNDRISVVGHDIIKAYNPARAINDFYDGFYLAAMVTGLKAAGAGRQTGKGVALKGVQAVLNTGITSRLLFSQKEALGAARLTAVERAVGGNTLGIRDHLTTAPYNMPDGVSVNPFAYANVRHVDDKVQRVLARAFMNASGQARATDEGTKAAFLGTAEDAMGTVAGEVNGSTAAVTSIPGSSVPTVTITYGAPVPTGTVALNVGLTL